MTRKYRHKESGCFYEAHPVTLFGEERMAVRQNPDEAVTFPTVARFGQVYEELAMDGEIQRQNENSIIATMIPDGYVTPRQAWEHAPEGATHLMLDIDGIWCWLLNATEDPINGYSDGWRKPFCTKTRWELYQGPPIHYTGDWEDSLHKRG